MGSALGSTLLALTIAPILIFAQDGAGSLGLEGIPYSPWLVPLAFLVGGMAYSAFGWYTSEENEHDITSALFNWRRFFKSALAGCAMGIIMFGMATSANVEAVSVELLHGGDQVVAPHEFAAAVGVAYGIIVTSSYTWKKLRRPRKKATGGAPA